MNNPIFEEVIKARQGHYCHCVEVSDRYELESIADSICDEYEEKYGIQASVEFLESLEVYCLDDNNEEEVFSFSFTNYIESL